MNASISNANAGDAIIVVAALVVATLKKFLLLTDCDCDDNAIPLPSNITTRRQLETILIILIFFPDSCFAVFSWGGSSQLFLVGGCDRYEYSYLACDRKE